MLLDGIIALLKADPGVSGLVADRVYESELPRGYDLPAVAVHQYGGVQEYQFDGPTDTREIQIQTDSYGRTALECRTVADAVEALLAKYVGTLSEGTKVQLCKLDRSMAMPFLPHADSKGIANRWTSGFTVIRG